MAAGAFTFGLTDQTKVSNGVVDDFAFVGAHRFEGHGLAGLLDRGSWSAMSVVLLLIAFAVSYFSLRYSRGALVA